MLVKLKKIAKPTTIIESLIKFSFWLINVETVMIAIKTAFGLIN
jgi:hypothetical protein